MNGTCKYSYLSQIICSLLIFLFVYTAMSKVTGFALFLAALSNSPLIGKSASILAWLLPPVELSVAALVFLPRTRKLGLFSSFMLMLVFTGYIAFMLLYPAKLPCSCGGVISIMNWKEHLIFNIGFTLIALAGYLIERKRTSTREQKAIHPL